MEYPKIPIQPVPITQRSQEQITRPFVDPANIIMQAAALKQQKDLAQQQLSQKSAEMLMDGIKAYQSLAEQKREADMHNSLAQMTLDLQAKKSDPEMELMRAHSNYFNQMAAGGDDAVAGIVDMVKKGLASPQDAYSLASRWPQNQKMRLAAEFARQGIDLKGLGLDLTAQKAGISAQFNQTNVQRAVGGKSIGDNFQDIVDQANRLGLNRVALYNKTRLAALRQINDPDVVKFDSARRAVSEEMGRYFAGNGSSSDMKIKLGQEQLANDGFDKDALQSIIFGTGGLRDIMNNQIKASQSISPKYGGTIGGTIAPQAGKIRVKHPDGRVGAIPAEQLQQALDAGYEQLQ